MMRIIFVFIDISIIIIYHGAIFLKCSVSLVNTITPPKAERRRTTVEETVGVKRQNYDGKNIIFQLTSF